MRLSQRVMQGLRPPKSDKLLSLRIWLRRISYSKKQRIEIDYELPDFSSALGLLLANGLPVTVALGWLTPRSHGEISKLFGYLLQELELGADPVELLGEMAKHPNQALGELCEKLAVALTRGAPVSSQVIAHAQSSRAALQRSLLRQAGSNETKMLIPIIFFILPITVLFAIFPSVLMLGRGI
ncbi:MAG: hypothetical protein EBS38_02470 [Actinobacteria bacterium]|nr:hypothetical protein [Actinomycetota bacterium]